MARKGPTNGGNDSSAQRQNSPSEIRVCSLKQKKKLIVRIWINGGKESESLSMNLFFRFQIFIPFEFTWSNSFPGKIECNFWPSIGRKQKTPPHFHCFCLWFCGFLVCDWKECKTRSMEPDTLWQESRSDCCSPFRRPEWDLDLVCERNPLWVSWKWQVASKETRDSLDFCSLPRELSLTEGFCEPPEED